MRKIIQLCRSNYTLVALCNDGTILKENGSNTGWDLMDYEVPQPTKVVQGKKVELKLPNNFTLLFDELWEIKGRKGSKAKAKSIYENMAFGESEDDLHAFTVMLCDHIVASADEIGFEQLHLTTYLNQSRWEQ